MSESWGIDPAEFQFRHGALATPPPPGLPGLARAAPLALVRPRDAVDWSGRLRVSSALGNDRNGNCVPIAVLRLLQLQWAWASGDPWEPSERDTLALYLRWAQDETFQRGTDPNIALADISGRGYRIRDDAQNLMVPRWIGVGLSRLDHLRLAIDLLGGVLLTMMLPVAGTRLDLWDVARPGSPEAKLWGCHEVLCCRYDAQHFYITSWDRPAIPCTKSALLSWAMRADALVNRRWIDATGKTPRGDRWDEVLAALSNIED